MIAMIRRSISRYIRERYLKVLAVRFAGAMMLFALARKARSCFRSKLR